MSSSAERLVLLRDKSGASPYIDPSAIPEAYNNNNHNNSSSGIHTPHTSLTSSSLHANNIYVDPSALLHNANDSQGGYQRTQYPYVTGSSVFGVTFKDGVIIAADTLASYGATKRYKSVERIKTVGANSAFDTNKSKCVIAAGGEISDFHYIMTLVEELATEEFCYEDGITMSPKDLHQYLCRVLYNRRNKFDPLWNSLLIGGVSIDEESGEAKPYLGSVGMIGTHFSDSHIATGFGQHLARPLFRNRHSPSMSRSEAVELLRDALKVCYYRDKNSINKFAMSIVTSEGVEVMDVFKLETEWDLKSFVNPNKDSVGAW